MADALSARALMKHVRALAEDIGPRPAGSPQEARAREYIRTALADAGISSLEELSFRTPRTWGYAMMTPLLLALFGNALSKAGRPGQAVGGLAGLFATYALPKIFSCQRSPLANLAPRKASANQIVRIPPKGERRHRLVLIGHTDTNKHRRFFSPRLKRAIPYTTTLNSATLAVNALALLARAAGADEAGKRVQQVTLGMLAFHLPLLLLEETGSFIDGASDNASAVACLLGLGEHLKAHPLEHTEVWLAFTGAEEVGCIGMHSLLDTYGPDLQNAWFLDFEMVGVNNIAYVTRHAGASLISGYAPDDESLALAEETAQQHPELEVTGRPVVIVEEVGALRKRGFRGLCLVGVGEDGWLANWHQYSDNSDNIEPEGLERAARFAYAMLQTLDARQ
jgi:hypothetical protein